MSPRAVRLKTEPPADDDVQVNSKSGKRRAVSAACLPCRRRKSKCDGALPSCSTCTAVYRSKCFYDIANDPRRRSPLKSDIDFLQSQDDLEPVQQQQQHQHQQNDTVDVIVTALRELPEADSIALLHTLRTGTDPAILAETLRANANLAQSGHGQHPVHAGIERHQSTGSRYGRGNESQPGAWTGSEEDRERSSITSSTAAAPWLRTPPDPEFTQHLLDLYFCWVHPFCPFFSQELFLRDMSRGGGECFNPLLLNAILAFACHYSDRPMARRDERDPSTAGEQFFVEAAQLLDANGAPSLTTVQALGVMSVRQTSCGRESSGYQYAGRCIRMALELGLHLSSTNIGQRSEESEMRKTTFWSVFNLETISAVSVGRMSQLPRSAVDVPRPSIPERSEEQAWQRYIDINVSPEEDLRQPAHSMLFFNELCNLCELASDMVNSFYAPREPFTSRRLAMLYGRFQEWYHNLPSPLWLENTSLPHVVVLHMYYHGCVLHLFRPYIKLDLQTVNLFPRDTCTACANKISELTGHLRSMYGLRRTSSLVPTLLLSATTIHLLHLPSETASTHLHQAMLDLEAMAVNHPFAGRCIEISRSLAAKWNIALPDEVVPGGTQRAVYPDTPIHSAAWTASISHQPHDMFDDGGALPPKAQHPQHQGDEQGTLRSTAALPPVTYPLYYASNYLTMEAPQNQQQQQQQQQQREARNPTLQRMPSFWTPFPTQNIAVGTQGVTPSITTPSMTAYFTPPFEDQGLAQWGKPEESGGVAAGRTTLPPPPTPTTHQQYSGWQWQQ